ncbi:MAG: hypothetical protein ACI4IQ_03345 [Eubacterium sp.]
MREFRKKQNKLKKIMNALIIATVAFILIYIFVQPFVLKVSGVAVKVCNYICDLSVIVSLITALTYYSKYGKSDSFLTYIENEISDAGFYLTSRQENTTESYVNALYDDLKNSGFSMSKNIELSEFEFDVRAMKRKEFFYIVNVDNVDKNDVLSYLDSVISDITISNLKRKGDAVLCFVTDEADEDAVALSKMITPLGKKEQIKIAIAIAEVNTKRVYFLGNMQTKCQSMIANYVMNCDVPIKDKYIVNERLPFQDELEEKMKSFNLKDFNNGNFYAH